MCCVQPVTWQVACNLCNQSHDRLHATSATRATSHMTGCMQPVTSATRHVTGCTHRASIRSARQKLSSKVRRCRGAEMRRCAGVADNINYPRKPKEKPLFWTKRFGCMHPVTRATCHVNGCTQTSSIRSVWQKLLSKMQRCGDAMDDIDFNRDP